jgi:hypothetical protein
MNTTFNKISISLPPHITDYLSAKVGKREVSKYITIALEEKMLRDTVDDPVETFIAMRKNVPKISDHAIRAAIVKGRT